MRLSESRQFWNTERSLVLPPADDEIVQTFYLIISLFILFKGDDEPQSHCEECEHRVLSHVRTGLILRVHTSCWAVGAHLFAAGAAPVGQRWEGGRLPLGSHSITQEWNISAWHHPDKSKKKKKKEEEKTTNFLLGLRVNVIKVLLPSLTCQLQSGRWAAPERTCISCAPAGDARLHQASWIHIPVWTKICLGSLNVDRQQEHINIPEMKCTLQCGWRVPGPGKLLRHTGEDRLTRSSSGTVWLHTGETSAAGGRRNLNKTGRLALFLQLFHIWKYILCILEGIMKWIRFSNV